MKILLIIDQYDRGNNGTTMTAQRLAHTLAAHGHEVRVVSTGNSKWKIPCKRIFSSAHCPPYCDKTGDGICQAG